jgi:hypothetical protein
MDACATRDQLSRNRSETLWTHLPALLPAMALFLWHASRYGTWLIDDAGISLAYARDLAGGFGLTSQPGAEPVEGFSNPLWTFVLALLYFLKLVSLPLVPKLLGCVLVLGSFVTLAAAVSQVMERTEVAIVTGFSLALTAANPGFVIWCISGLENSLLVALASGLLLAASRALRQETEDLVSLSARAGFLAAGLALTRPDGVIYSIVFPIACALRTGPFHARAFLKNMVPYSLCSIIPFGSYLLFRHVYFGSWLPNTYYAKTPGPSLDGLRDILHLWGPGVQKVSQLAEALFPFLPVLVLILPIAAIFRISRTIDTHTGRGTLLVVLFVGLSFVAFLILPWDWMGEYRFATTAFPFTYLLCLMLIVQAAASSKWTGAARAVPVLLGTVLLVASTPDFVVRSLVFADQPPTPLDTISRDADRLNELAAELGIKNPSLLSPDLGGTLLESRLRVVDAAGLCDREIARMFHAGTPPDQFAEFILIRVKPDFVYLHDFWARRSGLLKNQTFTDTYLDLGGGHYVRRASLPAHLDDESVRLKLAQLTSGHPPVHQ